MSLFPFDISTFRHFSIPRCIPKIHLLSVNFYAWPGKLANMRTLQIFLYTFMIRKLFFLALRPSPENNLWYRIKASTKGAKYFDMFIWPGCLIWSNVKYGAGLYRCVDLKKGRKTIKAYFWCQLVKIWALFFGLLLDIKFIGFPYLSIY